MSPLAHFLRLAIRVYQLTLSALIGRQCRFAPSCSEYAREALAVHGAVRGSWLAWRRVVRCHPWAEWGYDPVPPPNTPHGTPHGAAGPDHAHHRH